MKRKFRLLDSGLTDPEYQTFFGLDAKRVADFSLTATACAALATIPAVFFHASQSESLRVLGDFLGIVIWLIFVAETLVMIRLHPGWGGEWLKGHKLQLTVIFLANPLLIWAIGRFEALELFPLLPLPSFLQSAKIMKIFKFSKVLKFLHLGEVATKVRVSLAHIPWLVNSVLSMTAILAFGIIGAVLDGEAATPIHALDVWLEILNSIVSSLIQVILATSPIFVIGFVYLLRRKRLVIGS